MAPRILGHNKSENASGRDGQGGGGWSQPRKGQNGLHHHQSD